MTTTVQTTPVQTTPVQTTAVTPALHPILDAYHTAELATVARDGTPIAWPIMAVRDPRTDRFTVTTSIGFPAKALNIRRNEHVCLLFSESRGSGLSSPPRVLVQGTASCSDEIVTDPSELADYWRTLYRRQPAGTIYGANALMRRMFDWYYFRLVITVTPQRVTVEDSSTLLAAPTPTVAAPRIAGDTRPSGAPETTVKAFAPRIAGDTNPDAATARLGLAVFEEAVRRLRRYPSAVLTTLDHDGLPRSTRVRVAAAADRFLLPDAADVPDGPASLLAHHHNDHTWGLRSDVVVGDVRRRRGELSFAVRRVIPGASPNPAALVPMMRQARATAERYLTRRGLDRPVVPWGAYAELAHPLPR